MGGQLLRTKTNLPSPRSDLVARPHLVDRLENGFQQGQKLVLVSAPAGAGKSTLVSAWIRQMQHPAAWIALEEDDNDPSRFLLLLARAIKTILPGLSESTLALAHASPDLPPITVLTELINEIDLLETPFVLVLDDYEAIQLESVHAAANYLIDHCPAALHIVLISRVDPRLSLSRWRARGQLVELHAADLRFSRAEVAQFFTATAKLELSEEEIASLEQSIEGWAAGLQLVSLALRSEYVPQAAIDAGDRQALHPLLEALARTNRYVIDYLIEEVYNRQPEKIQSFLLRTSVLSRLSAGLCSFVVSAPDAAAENNHPLAPPRSQLNPSSLGVDESQSLLEYLERSNLFLVPLDAERGWYRYHPLFADALTSYLHKLHPEWVRVLYQRASLWLEQHGSTRDAIPYALASRDFEGAARLIEQIGDQLLWNEGEFALLMRWLGAIPAEVLNSHPRLLLHKAWLVLWSNRFEDVQPIVQAALQILPEDHPMYAAYSGEAAAILTELRRSQGDLPLMVAQAERAQRFFAQLPEHTAVGSVILGIIAGAYRASGEVREAARIYADAGRRMELEGKIPPTLIANGYQIRLLAIQGKLRQAEQISQHIQDWAEERHARSFPSYGMVLIEIGDVLREQNRLAEAESSLRDGIRLCLQMEGLADDTIDGLISQARLHQALGRFDRADAALEQASQLARKSHVPFMEAQVAAWRADFSLLRGELAAATHWAEELQLHPNDPFSFPQELEYRVLARWLIGRELPDQATPLLVRLLSSAEAGGRTAECIEVYALQALAFLQAGDPDRALGALARAFEHGEPEGFVRTFVDEGLRMEKLLRLAATRGSSGSYAAALLAAFKPLPVRPVTELAGAEPLVEPLTERELEVLRLMAGGLTNGEIAEEFYVSLGTVKSHINKIYRKLDVINRMRAIARAKELGLL